MTNKPMLSVERELIQRIADHCKFWTDHSYLEAIADVEVELRALLDMPTPEPVPVACATIRVERINERLRATVARFDVEQLPVGSLTNVYAKQSVSAAQQQGEPVVWLSQCIKGERAGHCEVAGANETVNVEYWTPPFPVYGKPSPLTSAEHMSCEVLEWLMENGTGCLGTPTGWIDFSDKEDLRRNIESHVGVHLRGLHGPAPVALVMTDEQILEAMRKDMASADGGYVVDTAPQDVIAAGRALLAEVTRLNEVNP